MHKSGSLGTVQGDATRRIQGHDDNEQPGNMSVSNPDFYVGSQHYCSALAGKTAMWYEIGSLTHNSLLRDGTGFGRSFTTRFDNARIVPIAQEIRPVNTAVRYLIRARD